ncbi:cell division protein FtsK [Bacillus thuringiensis serovar medellin]|uniref:Cell division protein FtsK n=2 Tax=Bacillus thuringiensis TaxID=1428 RepID=A0A9X6MWC0_BACTV|nr:DNA translocase FtsK [Bacillus thuringiensis]OUB92314.1 cell division protein FtsK [Bacillus thuringiensis serovar medellin]
MRMEVNINEVIERLYEPAKEFVIENQIARVSSLQRKFRIGYMTAAKIMDRLEENGIVGPYAGSQPRKVLVQK